MNESTPALTHTLRASWSAEALAWFDRRGIDDVVVFRVPLRTRFRSVTERSGLLVHGPHGWGECAPFAEYGPPEASTWLLAAVDSATTASPPPRRDIVAVNVTIPVSTPEEAAERVHAAGCTTAKVKVADPRVSLAEDAVRVSAVAEALAANHGSRARLRIDVNGAWQPDEACRAVELLNAAAEKAGGLEYVEQPCATVEGLAYVRARSGVPVAADESIRRADDPFRVVDMQAADVAVVKVAPLGGRWSALRLAEQLPIPVVVSSAIDTSVGLAAGVQLAAALPDLPYACGLDTARLLRADVTGVRMESAAGQLSVPLAGRVSCADVAGAHNPVDPEIFAAWTGRTEQMIACLSEVS